MIIYLFIIEIIYFSKLQIKGPKPTIGELGSRSTLIKHRTDDIGQEYLIII